MKNDDKVAVIGNIGYGVALPTKHLVTKEPDTLIVIDDMQNKIDELMIEHPDLIVVDENNLQSVVQEMYTEKWKIPYKEPIEVPVIELTRLYNEYQEPISKQRKPNKGLTLGSYTYRSGRK